MTCFGGTRLGLLLRVAYQWVRSTVWRTQFCPSIRTTACVTLLLITAAAHAGIPNGLSLPGKGGS